MNFDPYCYIPSPYFNPFVPDHYRNLIQGKLPASLVKYDYGPFEADSYYNPHPGKRTSGAEEAYRTIYTLRDARLGNSGDLGWPIGYATAYCYRHMSKNRIGITSAINHARRAPPGKIAPFLMFDTLDRNLFDGKLRDMVYLCWQRREADHPGVTYTPGSKAVRICIQLNGTPFDYAGDIDLMISMLVHHMIHAYFLVCCGSPKQGDKLDGRLLDGTHFGVLLSCINDITHDCEQGSLDMQFHAYSRQMSSLQLHQRMQPFRRSFIALDPTASLAASPSCSGQSCCQLDNRSITIAQIFNWQVEEYAPAINDNWAGRGTDIFVPRSNGGFKQMKRLEGPPSSTYCELVWNDKHIILPKEQISKCSALKHMRSDSKFGDAKLPACSKDVLFCLLHFIHFGTYVRDRSRSPHVQQTHSLGPPILLSPHSGQGESIVLHVRVCKLADTIRYPELRQEALRHLYAIHWTSDDPVVILRLIYDESSALSPDIQRWSRRFLARSEDSGQCKWQSHSNVSNYEKIFDWHNGRFLELYHKHAALRDDCKLAVACLAAGFDLGLSEHDCVAPTPYGTVEDTSWRGRYDDCWIN